MTLRPFATRDEWERELRRVGRWYRLLWHGDMTAGELVGGWCRRRWCRLRGHRWGAEQKDYEDAGYPVHSATWHQCDRCSHFEYVWHHGDRRP